MAHIVYQQDAVTLHAHQGDHFGKYEVRANGKWVTSGSLADCWSAVRELTAPFSL